MSADEVTAGVASRTLELAMRIQQIPAPTFSEADRGALVRELFLAEQLEQVGVDAAGNVLACLPRQTGEPPGGEPLIVCAHLDTVFPLTTDLSIRRETGRIFGPGIGDNSLGVASLFGLIWLLRGRTVTRSTDIWLVADVREEGLGDLGGMRAVADRFGGAVRGYLIIEGLAFGHVYHVAVGVRRYRVTVRTRGGHAWSDYGKPSAVHELAAIVARIATMDMPLGARSTLNVGTIRGGTGVNVLAAHAACELDLRSEDPDLLAQLESSVLGLLAGAGRSGVRVEVEQIGSRPAGGLPPDHPFVQLGLRSLREQGIEGELTSGSTDANVPFSRGLPAVVLGVTTGGGAHTEQEYIECEPVKQGLDQLVAFVSSVVSGR